jgi:hypothetical protein
MAGPPGYAASSQPSTIDFGLMGGLNISNITNLPQGVTSTSNTGFHVGAFMNFQLSQNFDMQVGCMYTQLGGTMTESESGQDSVSNGTTSVLANVTVTQSNKITYSYLQFPVSLVHKFGEGWNVHFGAYVGVLLSDKEQIAESETISVPGMGNQVANADTAINTTVGDNRLDFGLNLGIGYRLQNGLGIDFTYSFGLTNIVQASSGTDPVSRQYYTTPAFGSNINYCFTLSYLLK